MGPSVRVSVILLVSRYQRPARLRQRPQAALVRGRGSPTAAGTPRGGGQAPMWTLGVHEEQEGDRKRGDDET